MKTSIQFMLSKWAIAWMFALITINFNRIAIFDRGITAVIITTMIGLYPLFGPLQPYFARMTSRAPLFGYRRSPYLLIGLMIGSLVFPPLPYVLEGMVAGAIGAYVAGFLLYFIFGAMIALMANTYLDLVAECTTEETRGKVLAAAWTGQTAIIVVWALVFRWIMPVYSFESMQTLYNLTPIIVLILGIASIWNLETKLTPEEEEASRQGSYSPSSADAAPLKASLTLLQRPAARTFFLFVLLSFPSIFLQDSLQEVFGGEVLGLTVGQTTVFQQIFNGAVTLGMGLTAAFGAKALGEQMATPDLPAAGKRRLILFGGSGAILSLMLQALAALTVQLWLFNVALGLFGFTVGILTFAAVTMMSDMTVEGETGRYLGLWSLAQAVGLGLSFLLGGLLHTLLIGSGLFAPPVGYALIFGLEAVVMFLCVRQSQGSSVTALKAQAIPQEIRLGEAL